MTLFRWKIQKDERRKDIREDVKKITYFCYFMSLSHGLNVKK